MNRRRITWKRKKQSRRRFGRQGGRRTPREVSSAVLRHWSQSEEERLAHALQHLCPFPDTCVTWGRFHPLWNRLFRNFDTFALAVPSRIRVFGGESGNGMAVEIPYARHGMEAWCVFKTARSAYADNLWVEWWVGTHVVNPLRERFPCFVQTHGLFLFRSSQDASDWAAGKFQKTFARDGLEKWRHPRVSGACTNPEEFGLLVQHVRPSCTLLDRMSSPSSGWEEDSFEWMVQVYFVLDALSTTFRHRDLHPGNVLIQTPWKPGHFARLRYHSRVHGNEEGEEEIVEFRTQTLAVLIDYGRVWGYTPSGENSYTWLREHLCEAVDCFRFCGKRTGEDSLEGEFRDRVRPPLAHGNEDLRLVNYLFGSSSGWTARFPAWKTWTGTDVWRESARVLKDREQSRTSRYDVGTWIDAGTLDVYADGRPMEVHLTPS
jgi:hypothetical protein